MATEDTTPQTLHFDKRKMPVAVHKFSIKYYFKWNRCQRFHIAIDPVTNELYILCTDERGSEILVFDNTKFVREIQGDFLTYGLIIHVTNSAIFVLQEKSEYSLIKLSKEGNILSEIRTKKFQKLCFSQGMLYAATSEEMSVFDEDLRFNFDFKLHFQNSGLLMDVTINFNAVLICSNTLAGLKIYMYTLDGYPISQFQVIREDLSWLFIYVHFSCMDSVGSIIALEAVFDQSQISVVMLEFGNKIEYLGKNLLKNVKAVLIDNQDRIVCVDMRSITYNIYIF